jgi:hypothetical protein
MLFEEEATAMAEERVLTRQELHDLVWSQPMNQLAKEFNLSAFEFAKICQRFAIPRPQSGHWQKVAVGKAQKQPELPSAPQGVSDQIRFIRDLAQQAEPIPSAEVAVWIEQERDPAKKILVPTTLSRYHPLVRATKNELESHSDNHHGLRWSREALPLLIGAANIGRAMRLLHALFTAIEARGGQIERSDLNYHTGICHFLGEKLWFTLEERATKDADPSSPRRWKPSGILKLEVSHYGNKRDFKDRKDHPIEEQLNEVVLALARLAIESARPARLQQEEERRKQVIAEEQQRAFERKTARFERAFNAWKEHQERVRFVETLESALTQIESPDESIQEYVAWTRRYANWANPLPKFFDELRTGTDARYHRFAPEQRWFGR